jgi:serine/threonine-protein kinase
MHYALGRGRLALQEPEAALDHLKQASAVGYRSTGLDYAMGVSLSALYKKALESTKRIENAEKRKARIAAIEADYKAPALQHLRAALGDSIEAPAYVEGLIALYEGRHEDARALAQEAHARAPWLYEAKKLEGDVLFAMGNRHSHDAAFDYEKMIERFRAAAEAYGAASDHGRSDPANYEAECELWTQIMNAASERGEPVRPVFEKAKSACERAITASSRSGAGYVKLAWAHNCFTWWVSTGEHPGEDPEVAIKEALEHAEEAARRSPDDPMARYLTGAVSRTRVFYRHDRGLDIGPDIERAVAGYEEVIRLDPTFLWALSELCSTLALQIRHRSLHGTDPKPFLEKAIEQCDRATALDPGFMPPRANKVIAYINWAEHLAGVGQAPKPAVEHALEVIEAMKKQGQNARWIPSWLTHLSRIEAAYALESGADAGPIIERAEASVAEAERLNPSSLTVLPMRGQVFAVKARWLLARGEDPTAPILVARPALRRIVEAKPWDLGYRVASAMVELTAIRAALAQGDASAAHFDAALAPLLPLLNVSRDDPRLYQTLAEIYEARASWLRGRRRAAKGDIERGLAMADEALARNPRMSAALAVKSRLLLLGAERP